MHIHVSICWLYFSDSCLFVCFHSNYNAFRILQINSPLSFGFTQLYFYEFLDYVVTATFQGTKKFIILHLPMNTKFPISFYNTSVLLKEESLKSHFRCISKATPTFVSSLRLSGTSYLWLYFQIFKKIYFRCLLYKQLDFDFQPSLKVFGSPLLERWHSQLLLHEWLNSIPSLNELLTDIIHGLVFFFFPHFPHSYICRLNQLSSKSFRILHSPPPRNEDSARRLSRRWTLSG